jgi:hypothetical protein
LIVQVKQNALFNKSNKEIKMSKFYELEMTTSAHKAIMMRTCQNDFLKDWILEILHENNCNMIGSEAEFDSFINKQTKFETDDDIDEILYAGYAEGLIDGCLT